MSRYLKLLTRAEKHDHVGTKPVIVLRPSTSEGCAWMDCSIQEAVDRRPAGTELKMELANQLIADAQCGAPAEFIVTSATNGKSSQLCLEHACVARMHPRTSVYIATMRTK